MAGTQTIQGRAPASGLASGFRSGLGERQVKRQGPLFSAPCCGPTPAAAIICHQISGQGGMLSGDLAGCGRARPGMGHVGGDRLASDQRPVIADGGAGGTCTEYHQGRLRRSEGVFATDSGGACACPLGMGRWGGVVAEPHRQRSAAGVCRQGKPRQAPPGQGLPHAGGEPAVDGGTCGLAAGSSQADARGRAAAAQRRGSVRRVDPGAAAAVGGWRGTGGGGRSRSVPGRRGAADTYVWATQHGASGRGR